MRAYLAVTALCFGALAGVHAWRLVVEPRLLTSPVFMGITLVAAGLAVWGATLLKRR